MSLLRRVLERLAERQDLCIILLLVTSILLMILPLPTILIDFALATNMALTVLLLMVAVYLRDPLELSMLPSVILIATVFRLSLSIATTRLILLQADAGNIVRTFGEFVVAGNLIVGLVIFLIITIVQFLVITKGSERVAEVSARFTLDALPGKQMSIDAELRGGEIDKEEARRRQHLEKDGQLYGAMDGAMKFVKGDAIAGLVIIAVNILGGVAVGTIQHGLTMGEALQIYSVLTVGDGLVAQIPALFMSLTAGAIVTRVTTEDSRDLGTDILGQITSEPRASLIAGTVLLGIGIVPGFPTPIFLILAMVLIGIGIAIQIRRRTAAASATSTEAAEAADRTAALEDADGRRIILRLGAANDQGPGEMENLAATIQRLPRDLEDELGFPFPSIGFAVEPALEPTAVRIDLDGVPILQETMPLDRICACERKEHLELMDIAMEPGPKLAPGVAAFWVDAAHLAQIDDAGFAWLSRDDVLAKQVKLVLRRHAAQFLGLKETQHVLQHAEKAHHDLVREVLKTLPLQKMTELYRRLVDEEISLKPQRLLLEAALDLAHREQDLAMLAEYLRGALSRQICHARADDQKVIPVFLMERSLEEALRQSVKHTSMGSHLALPDRTRRRLLDLIRLDLRRAEEGHVRPVVLTSLDVRRRVRQLLARNEIHVPVMAHSEIARDFRAQPITTLRLAGTPTVEAAAELSQAAAPHPA